MQSILLLHKDESLQLNHIWLHPKTRLVSFNLLLLLKFLHLKTFTVYKVEN